MSSFLPKKIDPWLLAERQQTLVGTCALDEMPRLRGYLLDAGEEVSVELAFGVDEEGLRFVKGVIEGTLTLQCQRCMGTMVVDIRLSLSLGIVKHLEQAMSLPERYEPLVVEEAHTSLWTLVEDELILSLPIVARHPVGECSINIPVQDVEKARDTRQDSPFAALKGLKTIT